MPHNHESAVKNKVPLLQQQCLLDHVQVLDGHHSVRVFVSLRLMPQPCWWPLMHLPLPLLPCCCDQMSNLVTEKELGLRQALRNMGMKESAYWFSWAAFDVFMSLIIALLICIFGERLPMVALFLTACSGILCVP